MDQEPTGELNLESPLQTNLMWWVNPSRAYEVIAAWVQTDPLPKDTMFHPQRFETLVKDVMYNPNKSTFGDSGRRDDCYTVAAMLTVEGLTTASARSDSGDSDGGGKIAAAVVVKMRENILWSW